MRETEYGADATEPRSARAADADTIAQAQARRRADLLAAADKVVREHGAETSASLIAKAAGVTKPIIYRHFTDIDDLYRELGRQYRADLAEYMYAARQPDLDRAGRYRTVVDAFFRAVENQPNIFRFVMAKARSKESALSWFTQGWASDTAAYFVLEAGQTQESTRWNIIGFAMIGAMQTAASHWLVAGGPREEAVDALVDLLLNGLPQPVEQVAPVDYPCQVGVQEINALERGQIDLNAVGQMSADLPG